MKIAFLGRRECRIFPYLEKKYEVMQTEEVISTEEISKFDPELVVSFGYRHIIKKPIIEQFRGKMINLHISYLPWNRGASPNLWSIVDKTPKGVTIHLIDEGVDTGDIIFQKIVPMDEELTLRESYDLLQSEIQDLFIEKWDEIKGLDLSFQSQNHDEGTLHTIAETEDYMRKIGLEGWDIKIGELIMRSDEEIINEIQEIREKNNTHWMDIVKLAFEVSPVKSREIFKKIKDCDEKVNELLKELAEND